VPKPAKLFFLLSGESETLPASEVKAILEAEGYGYANPQVLDQILQLEADPDCAHSVQVRAAFARLCALEIFVSDATEDSAVEAARKSNFEAVLKLGESFSVRVNRIKNYADEAINTMRLEGKLGKTILQRAPQAKVNLKSPDKTFIGIVTSNKFIFGLKLTEVQSRTFSERRPRKKPFFHPSAMPSKLARCMVNLAHGKTEGLMLDPFCGTGTSLIEATYIGCRALGADAQRRMILGCKKNLAHFNITAEGLVLADARRLPFRRVDCVVTDPPYGRSASTLKSTTKQLVQEVLAASYQLLGVGQRICIALPITGNGEGKTEQMSVEVANLVNELGYRTIESHKVFIHRTLTREIMVYEKTA
jgi:tRNA (guanine10-N2)-dimethyltransferase